MSDNNTISNCPTWLFDSYPYLLTHLDRSTDHLRLLPEGYSRETLIRHAKQHHKATGIDVTLCIGRSDYLSIGSGETSTSADAPANKPLLRVGPIEGQTRVTSTENLYRRWRYFALWHAYTKGYEPFFSRDTDESDPLIRATGNIPERLGEIIRFLRLANHLARRSDLYAIPSDGPELLRGLAAFNDLAEAWRSGWIWKSWRAWLAEIATGARLLPRDEARLVNRIHGREASQPGPTTQFFGQALARELPELFDHLDHRALENHTRESLIGFVA